MQKLNYKGHEVEIYEGYNGDEVFITKGETKIYSARVNKGAGLERAKQVIG